MTAESRSDFEEKICRCDPSVVYFKTGCMAVMQLPKKFIKHNNNLIICCDVKTFDINELNVWGPQSLNYTSELSLLASIMK